MRHSPTAAVPFVVAAAAAAANLYTPALRAYDASNKLIPLLNTSKKLLAGNPPPQKKKARRRVNTQQKDKPKKNPPGRYTGRYTGRLFKRRGSARLTQKKKSTVYTESREMWRGGKGLSWSRFLMTKNEAIPWSDQHHPMSGQHQTRPNQTEQTKKDNKNTQN